MTDQVAPPSQPAGGEPAGAPAQPAASAKPSAGKGIAKRIIGGIIVFAVIGIGGVAWKYLTGDPQTAAVGDCLVGQDENTLKVVKCDDATVEWKVVGKVENKTQTEGSDADTVCAAYSTSEAAYWWGKGSTGDVLCLEPVKK